MKWIKKIYEDDAPVGEDYSWEEPPPENVQLLIDIQIQNEYPEYFKEVPFRCSMYPESEYDDSNSRYMVATYDKEKKEFIVQFPYTEYYVYYNDFQIERYAVITDWPNIKEHPQDASDQQA